MTTLTILDAGHRFTVQVKEGALTPALAVEDVPNHIRFITWWKQECKNRGIPYEYRVAEPQGHAIVRVLVRTRSLERLQELARHFFLDYGDKLRENPNHFALFTSLIAHMEGELPEKDSP